MWKRIKAFTPPLIGLASLVACAIVFTVWWHVPVQPATVLPIMMNAKLWLISPDGRWVYLRRPEWPHNIKDELIKLPNGPRFEVDWHYIDPGAFSADGKFFVGVRNGHWCLWNLETEEPEQPLHKVIGHERIMFSPDSQKVVLISRPGNYAPFLQVWDARTRRREYVVPADQFFGKPPPSYVCANVEWGLEQTLFVEKTDDDPKLYGSMMIPSLKVYCWDLQQARIRFQIDHLAPSGYRRPTWRISPDGKRCVAIVTDKSVPHIGLPDPFRKNNEINVAINPIVQSWDVATGKLLWQRPFPPEHAFFVVSFTPDSQKIAISSRDLSRDNRAELQMWNIEGGSSRTLLEFKPKGSDGAFVLTPSGRYLQYADPPWSGDARFPNRFESRIVGGWWRTHENEASPAITFDDVGHWFDRDGNKHELFSTAEKTEDVTKRRVQRNSRSFERGIEAPGVWATLSPDESWLAMRLTFVVTKAVEEPMTTRHVDIESHELHLLDLRTGEKAPIIHGAERWLFSPDGSSLITAGAAELRIYELPLVTTTWHRWALGVLIIALLCVQFLFAHSLFKRRTSP